MRISPQILQKEDVSPMNSLFLTAADSTTTSSLDTWLSALTKLNLSTILAAVVIFLVGYMLIKWAA